MKSYLKMLSAALLLCCSMGASASVITPDAGWYGFCFGGAGSGATEGCQNDGVGVVGNTIDLTLSGDAWVKVTDAFNIGDILDVYIDSLLAFTTSVPGAGTETSNPDVAFGSGYYSAGSILLSAGVYEIDIFANTSPFGGGGAYIEVESTRVPVPMTLALFGLGLVGLGLSRRKKS